MFCMMIDVGSKFYSAPPPTHVFDLHVKVTELTFYVEVSWKVFEIFSVEFNIQLTSLPFELPFRELTCVPLCALPLCLCHI